MNRINISLDDDILEDLEYLKVSTGIDNRSKLISIGVKLLKFESKSMVRKLADKADVDLREGLLSMLD